ncbi:MAG: DNA repair protein RecN [Proteobacteria bacterium]|nr:DNA repair protein RecN [Pseudomonadota bacterium]
MLSTLKVRDLVLIAEVSLDFAPGLNVLTGETGAGKSILLDALGLAAGARAGARSSVRPGAQQGSASAVFDLAASHPARALIFENGIASEDEIILRRVISSDGRTRAFVNDDPAGVGLLRDVGELLVEIHGQADDRGLFDSATHRRLLDAFGGHEALVREVADRFADYERQRQEAEAFRRATEQATADADYVRHAAQELSALDPQAGEEESLAAERSLLMNASKIAEDVSTAVELLSGEKGAEASLAAALKRLVRMNEQARKLATPAEVALESAFAQAEEARRELESFLSKLDVDAGELERKEERLFALKAAARKYAVPVDGLPAKLTEFQAKLDAIDGGGGKLKAAQAAAKAAQERFLETGHRLSTARTKAARSLDSAVAGELVPLKLGHAKFRVALEAVPDGSANGLERVAFEVATVEGASYGPLARIASGGELARFSLALKVALSEASPPAALVFDEVDRGVGGAVADAVGERLQRLAKSTQVLLVTHAPQVAARAERHFRITRKGDRTEVHRLSESEREEEIARMLSGAAVTDEARAAARRLLAEAQTTPRKVKKRA